MVDRTLVEKILEQGQKLRNAMVESILKNDPLYNMEIIYDKHYNSPKSSASELLVNIEQNENASNFKKLEAFLRGDYLTKDEERYALKTITSMSAPDLCKATDRTFSGRLTCRCSTCTQYNVNNLKCDLRRTIEAENITTHIQNKYKAEYLYFLKYVDSMKVTVYNIVLNSMGIRKVFLPDNSSKLPYNSVGLSYFIEYKVPDMIKTLSKNKSKVDTGLENNHIKICSRSNSEVISIKQTFIHDIVNLDKVSLEDVEVTFKINYRNQKAKTSCLLGFAKFHFKGFEISKNLTCVRGLAIHISENSPVVVGTLKVSFQLGCGKCYFGKEFIDNFTSNKQSSLVLDSDDIGSDQFNLEDEHIIFQNSSSDVPVKDTQNIKKPESRSINVKNDDSGERSKKIDVITRVSQKTAIKPPDASEEPTHINESTSVKHQITDSEKQILFGFVYIPEAQYFTGSKNTYLTCRPFSQDETSVSRLVVNSAKPIFMFFQNIPLLYEDDLLAHLRENYMVIEFWEKLDTSNVVFGLSKIDLHQFYLAYRNPVISKHLRDNKLPVIGSDWWEPIYNLNDNELLGQVQVLTALGTEQQIEQLKQERGFKNDMVKAKFPAVQKDNKTADRNKSSTYFRDKFKINNNLVQKYKLNNQPTSKDSKNNKPKEVDIGVQVQTEVVMDSKEDPKKASPTQDMIGSFLNQILALKQKNVCVENSTNTDNPSTTEISNRNVNIQNAEGSTTIEMGKKSDLLESLQTALAVETNQQKVILGSDFKALVSVNSANHLPSRKKFKSKKMRGRSAKHEENVLPSTYVTFESLPNSSLNITPVVPKCTAPRWDYKCEVKLPVDLLTNNQKRLILKVWKKSTNTVMQPNLQTDVVLGFAAVDLSVLLAGLPSVQGWFNIIDFSGKCNGQINVHVTPLENLSQWNTRASVLPISSTVPAEKTSASEEPGELLSRALKRKFTELDEITQRLRLRLSEVTTEDSEDSNDDATTEFERDINTLCVEDDFDLINFEEEAKKFSENHNRNIESKNEAHLISIASNGKDPQTSSHREDTVQNKILTTKPEHSSTVSSSGSQNELVLDQQLLQGKQRIDTLLEKLTLISSDTSNIFSSRYVSGCSVTTENVDTEGILKDLDHFSRPNIQGMQSFDPLSFQQLYGGSMHSLSGSNSNDLLTPCSEVSTKTDFSDCRVTPDGKGNTTDDKK